MTNDPQAEQHTSPGHGHRGLSLLFGATICLGAFLLFQVQPLEGKIVLPWFGGAPMVWTTCLLFYQALLLGGYLYAHALTRVRPRTQASIHVIVLILSVAAMAILFRRSGTPIMPADSWKPVDSQMPVWRILRILFFTIGLPYFVLSTTSSLLQAWFSRLHSGRSPYRFYAISNVGSLVGLLTYPVLVEPTLQLQHQALVWSASFCVYAALCVTCTVVLARGCRGRQQTVSHPGTGSRARVTTRPAWSTMAVWLALAAIPVIMMMATTNQMSADVAPIPFLWVLGLGIYLVSFILAFSTPIPRARVVLALLMLAAAFLTCYALDHVLDLAIAIQLLIYSAVLFLACTLCHGELYRLKPHPEFLTLFYLVVALGGVIGGILVAIAAPAVFSGHWEFHLVLLASSGVAVLVLLRSAGRRRSACIVPISGLFLVLLLLLDSDIRKQRRDTMHMTRNFYGSLRAIREEVQPGLYLHALMHGRVCHGYQLQKAKLSLKPTAYFGPGSGVGLALTELRERAHTRGLRIGVLGLGIGTLSAYGRNNDVIRYYEINPEVIDLALVRDYFTYLATCPSQLSVVQGDARLSLERELRQGERHEFDLLAVDVLNGDAVPTHLLTREAVDLYLAHLQSDGILAFDITNAYLDLAPVVCALGRAASLAAVVIHTPGDGKLTLNASWVLLSRDPEIFAHARFRDVAVEPGTIRSVRVWTDSFSNLYRAIRR